PYRFALAVAAALLILASAGWAFRRLCASGKGLPPPSDQPETPRAFIADRAGRIALFFVSLVIVSAVAHVWSDAHSLVGRLSALPLVPLFVLHWAVNARRTDLDELPVAALLGPVGAAGFLFAYAFTLGFIRTDSGVLHPGYWPVGLAALLIEWELTRLAIIGMARMPSRKLAAAAMVRHRILRRSPMDVLNLPRPAWMTEDLVLLEEQAGKFLAAEFVPHLEEWHEAHIYPREVWTKAGQAGLLCAMIPEQYGGGGGSFAHEAVINSQFSQIGFDA